MTEQPTAASRSTVGLTPAGRQALQALMDKGWFNSGDSAFRSAVAYAIAHDLAPTPGGPFPTIWSTATIDKVGNFREVVSLLLDDTEPWDSIQALGDAGLRAMAELAAHATLPTEVLLPDQ